MRLFLALCLLVLAASYADACGKLRQRRPIRNTVQAVVKPVSTIVCNGTTCYKK